MIKLTYRDGKLPHSRATFFDKDGTLVVDQGFVHKLSDFKWSLQGLLILRLSSILKRSNFVVTNQSGINKKIFTKQNSIDYCNHLYSQAKQKKCEIIAIYICPHVSYQCECRKPKPMTFNDAFKSFSFDKCKVLMVGNSLDDKNFAKNIGAKYIDVNSRFAWLNFLTKAFLN